MRRVLGLDPGLPLPARQGFASLGMDSLMSVELRNRLQRGRRARCRRRSPSITRPSRL
jgi:hypothetical protein